MKKTSLGICFLALSLLMAFTTRFYQPPKKAPKIRVILDTDANNELDDQHALAYLLFSGNTFAVEGITVNATANGGNIDEQYAEAERVLQLCGRQGSIPLYKGANAGFAQIREHLGQASYDGSAAVNFLIRQAKSQPDRPLVVIAVGKLTNVALALAQEPAIARQLRVVWLGSNYPEPGEYNQDNDTTALNYVLNSRVPFEMVTVRYGKTTGTHAVQVSQQQVAQYLAGKGPRQDKPVVGRHQGSFHTFGDYAVNLFQHIQLEGNPPGRALYDMAAVAIVKNPAWASARRIPAPMLQQNHWVERPKNPRKITVWENFRREQILADFFQTLDQYVLAERK